jgi:uncharacterized protein DUF4157
MSQQAHAQTKNQMPVKIAPLHHGLLQRKCACGQHTIAGGECERCDKNRTAAGLQRAGINAAPLNEVPSAVHEVLGSPGQSLDAATRNSMESRFGHDFSQVRVHTGEQAAQSTQAVNALAFTVGKDIVFGAGQYAPSTQTGSKLLAHELAHTIQQSGRTSQNISRISQPGDAHEQEADRVAEQVGRLKEPLPPSGDKDKTVDRQVKIRESGSDLSALQRQTEGEEPQAKAQEEEEGIEVGDQIIMMLPRSQFVTLPETEAPSFVQPGTSGELQREEKAKFPCPRLMRKVISGKFEGGKTLNDYFPDKVGTHLWGNADSAGRFDNGLRAGSAVQLIGEIPSPCNPAGVYTLAQTATVVRFRVNGRKALENGKVVEGTTVDDLERSKRDYSREPARQQLSFAISMADAISGVPYSNLKSYEFEVNLTSSISGPGGTQSVDWGVTIEAVDGKLTNNELR